MKVGSLMMALSNFKTSINMGAVFVPFVPKKNETICTVFAIESTGILFEEVQAYSPAGNILTFSPDYWKEITDAPSIEEVTEIVDECGLVEKN
jgi:hypothetical protein